MKTKEINGVTYTKNDQEELMKLCEEFLNGDTSPEVNLLRAKIMAGYDEWDDEEE